MDVKVFAEVQPKKLDNDIYYWLLEHQDMQIHSVTQTASEDGRVTLVLFYSEPGSDEDEL